VAGASGRLGPAGAVGLAGFLVRGGACFSLSSSSSFSVCLYSTPSSWSAVRVGWIMVRGGTQIMESRWR